MYEMDKPRRSICLHQR